MSSYIDSLVVKIVTKLAEETSERPRVEMRVFVHAVTGKYVCTCWTVPRLEYPQPIEPSIQAAVRELARGVGVL